MDPVRQTAISKFDLFRFRNLGYGSFSELLHFLSVTIVIYAKSCSRPHTQLKKSKIACAKGLWPIRDYLVQCVLSILHK